MNIELFNRLDLIQDIPQMYVLKLLYSLTMKSGNQMWIISIVGIS